MKRLILAIAALTLTAHAQLGPQDIGPPPIVLHAAHLLDINTGKLLSPGEVLVIGDRIRQVGSTVTHPNGANVIELGDTTLMPGLIDAHVHLFLHPGAEDLQTVQESIPERTLMAASAAKADLMAGFTAERDMGTEGAGCADTAVRNAIDRGDIPGPRMRVSCNAIDILGGHEDAIGFNPAVHVPSNADYANNTAELIRVMREQRKDGADFTKIYETGPDSLVSAGPGKEAIFTTPFQFTEEQLAAAVAEAHRTGSRIGVHCTGEPGARYAAEAGVASIDHAYHLSTETMRLMRDKQIYAVPTFTIMEYFARHPEHNDGAKYQAELDYHAAEFKKQLAAGVTFAIGSDVGPFPHGTQAREFELMVQYGMTPIEALRADLLNGAKLLDWADSIGQLKPGFFADIIAVPGDPLTNISALKQPVFVMKDGEIILRKHPAPPR